MKLTTLRGIPIYLHVSFLLLAGLGVLWSLLQAGTDGALRTLLLGVALFGSVLLHELGHALMARRFGIETRSITLYPFGGVAALTAEPRHPTAEVWIAAAGPAVNLLLAALALPLVLVGVPGAGLLAGMNVALGAFNLLPAFPMDGGRVLRALLSARQGARVATTRALALSRWFAWGFVGLGLVASPNLLLVGGFLLFAIAAEQQRLDASTARPYRTPPLRHDAHVHPRLLRWEHAAH